MAEMIPNDEIQEALVDYAKSKSTILAKLTDTDEIREDQWAGREFSYPAVRVRMMSNTPDECKQEIEFSLQAYSENSSSQQADDICGTINDEFHDKSFTQNGIKFTGVICSNLAPAIRQDKRTWRAESFFRATVS